MEKIVINTPGSRSEIMVGAGWKELAGLLPESGVVIITDDNVRRLYGNMFPDVPVLSVSPGEESKRMEMVEELAEKLLDAGMDRNGFILAVGGGVVCDLGGFLASIYMRGIRFGYVSSTLLSQVDASTGGKNGVNLGGTKNILGVFRQPEFVICNTEMLMTLPPEEYLSGLAEMIKTAIIGDKAMFDLIEANYRQIMDRDPVLLTELIARSVRFKASVVGLDEKEKGLRRILNFGHTYGHAIEMQTRVRHGFAVAAGMELATLFSYEKGYTGAGDRTRIIDLLNQYGLIKPYNIPWEQIESLVRHDKKKTAGGIYFVFVTSVGEAVTEKITVNEVIDFYKNRIKN